MNKGRILITGADGSLGGMLMVKASSYGWDPVGIKMEHMRSKNMIENMMMASHVGFGNHPKAIINCHGINHLSWIGQTSTQDLTILMENLMAPYWVINEAVALGWGPCRVINVASQTHRVPQRCTAIYAASKAGLVQMTRVMARELAPKGWVINAVSPGKMEDTNMSAMTDVQVENLRGWTKADADRYALSNIPVGRFTSTNEICEVIYKTLDLPDYVNGAVIEAHGGV